MKYSIDSTVEALGNYMLGLRKRTPYINFPTEKAASSDIRTGYINDSPVSRLVITLRSPGCEWVKKGGGCVMCGHFAGTTQGIIPSPGDTIAQFRTELSKYDIGKIGILSIYNSGSVLNPSEVEPDALETIFRDIANISSVRKVILESRAEYINPERVGRLADILGKDRLLTIAVGLETSDDLKRALCVNKGTSTSEIKNAVESLGKTATTQIYVLLGLPFLTETESIEDTVESIKFAKEIGAGEIHIEPMTVQRYTLIEQLAERGLYRLPSVYSIYEVLRRVVPEIRPYVSPFMHMPLPEKIPGGCPFCTHKMINGLLNIYNIRREISSLEYDNCNCIGEWRKRLAEKDCRTIEERVSDSLEILEGASI
jgi:archaeosine synthase beta-subunit